jgi:hypothetical protein
VQSVTQRLLEATRRRQVETDNRALRAEVDVQHQVQIMFEKQLRADKERVALAKDATIASLTQQLHDSQAQVSEARAQMAHVETCAAANVAEGKVRVLESQLLQDECWTHFSAEDDEKRASVGNLDESSSGDKFRKNWENSVQQLRERLRDAYVIERLGVSKSCFTNEALQCEISDLRSALEDKLRQATQRRDELVAIQHQREIDLQVCHSVLICV